MELCLEMFPVSDLFGETAAKWGPKIVANGSQLHVDCHLGRDEVRGDLTRIDR